VFDNPMIGEGVRYCKTQNNRQLPV
jgi:hypothetical protein